MKKKIDFDEDLLSNIINLKKNNKYKFKYYPDNNELIINFFDFSSNDIFNKTYYSMEMNNLYINYNLLNTKINDNITLFFDINGAIKINGYFSNEIIFDNSLTQIDIETKEKYINIKANKLYNYLNINIFSLTLDRNDFKIYQINEIITINQINSKYNLEKGKNILLIINSEMKSNYSRFNSFTLLSIKNPKNVLKLMNSEGLIIDSNNFLITNILYIKGIFISIKEDDIFEINLIPEKVSKNIEMNVPSFYSNIIRQNKKWKIDYFYQKDYNLLFYQAITNIDNSLQIYQLNNENNILEDLINDKLDSFKEISEITILEPYKTYIFINKCKNQCLYMKYIDENLNFQYILFESRIIYLYMDFDYKISLLKNITQIKIKKFNNFENSINFICKNNHSININEVEKIIDLNDCGDEFTLKGNNNLVYIYLPLTSNENYEIINGNSSFNLINATEFFFIPNNNKYNSINILVNNKDFENYNNSILIEYRINNNIIPFSSIIEKNYINVENSSNIIVPNYKQNKTFDEKYFIYFKIYKNISNLEINITYENIITLENKENSLILPSGINILQLDNQQNYYINILKSNIEDNLTYSIFRNYISNNNETNIELQSDNIYFYRNSSYDDMRIQIKNKEEILFSLSPSLFYDLSMVIYDTKIQINQQENVVNIKFNTTDYLSKIEYDIIIFENDNITNNTNITNITNYLYHKKISDNFYIYKNIISSIGIEPISIDLKIDEPLTYNKSYITYILGKENFGDSFHYIYYEPEKCTLIKTNPKNDSETKSDDTESKTDINTDDKSEKDKSTKSSKTGLIVGIIFGVIGFIAIVLVGFYFYRKNKIKDNSLKQIEELKPLY